MKRRLRGGHARHHEGCIYKYGEYNAMGEKHNVYMIEYMRRTFSTDKGDPCLMIALSQHSRDKVLLEKSTM